MEASNIIFIIFSILVMFLIIFKGSDEKPLEEQMFEDEQQLDIPYKDRWYNRDKEDEEIFHHPVTGYSGNRANMDAYIINRERKLRNGN